MNAAQRDEFVAGVAEIVAELNVAGVSVLQILDTPAVSPEQASPSLFLNNPRIPIQRGAVRTNAEVAKQLGFIAQSSNGRYRLAEITTGLCSAVNCRYVNNDYQPLWLDTDHLSQFGVSDRTEPLRSVIEKALAQTTSP